LEWPEAAPWKEGRMQIGMIGLGRMGMNMARRLIRGGHEVVAYNRTREKSERLAAEGAEAAFSLEELVKKLAAPRAVWLMLPAGATVDEHLTRLAGILSRGDMVIDGGNTYYKDDVRRAELLGPKGIHYVDVGVSGGVWGLEAGYCLMVGGEKRVYDSLEPVFRGLAPAEGVLYCGATGAGHFLKMVHNGIEYGMMQAYAEGFGILDASAYSDDLDYAKVAHLWNQGSVIRSWLLELAEGMFSRSARLTDIGAFVEDSGEGRWTALQAVESGVPAPVLTLSLMSRFRSRVDDNFSDKVVAALRREFGGHAVRKTTESV